MTAYLERLTDHTESTRSGYALAIGAFPKFMLKGKLKQVLAGFINSQRASSEKSMAEATRDTMTALAQ